MCVRAWEWVWSLGVGGWGVPDGQLRIGGHGLPQPLQDGQVLSLRHAAQVEGNDLWVRLAATASRGIRRCHLQAWLDRTQRETVGLSGELWRKDKQGQA